MKKLISFILLTMFALPCISQSPQGINYQAVARNAQGLIIPGQNISVRFSILDGSITGTLLYQETHSATTNNYGLFTLAIGKGVPVTATFAGINWASGTDKFLKVEIAPTAGGTYDLQGTTQLLSVPYALYAEKTKLVAGAGINITGGNTISATGSPAYTAGNAINITGSTIAAAYTAGPGVNITGPVISGAYQGGNAISVTGNTIAANYTAGTGINITGPVISGAYQGGNAISVTGSTIAANYTAGTGINITGPVISGAYQGGNAISVTGNTIAANYTAGTGINITGATISGAYQGGNAISVTGNTIAANYTAGTGINITGSTISHNLVAGAGINIAGNVISAPGSSGYWLPDPNGIYYSAGHVGIGGNSASGVNAALQITQQPTGGFSRALEITSNDTWQTLVTINNLTVNRGIQFNMAGSGNTDMPPGSFGILGSSSPTPRWILNTDGTNNNYLAIGSFTHQALTPKSRLHVFAGDINIDQIGSGIIMKSPNGSCWRITIDNTGNLIRTAITCP